MITNVSQPRTRRHTAGGRPETTPHSKSRADEKSDRDAANRPSRSSRGRTNGRQQDGDGMFPKLSNRLEQDLVKVFKLLSDETRLKILMFLGREGELHVSALCKKLGQSQPAVSHHLALLRNAGIIEPRRDGKHNYYSLCRMHFHELISEVFQTISDADAEEIRFDDFVLTHTP